MINAVTIINYLGDSMKLDLMRPEESGFIVEKITGLGPVKADINATNIASSDGEIYNSSRIGRRNIVLSLKFMFSPTIEAVRLKSYKYFPTKKPLTLIFETDTRIAEITGRVESNEPDIFTKKEGCQISIICSDPYFYSAGENGTKDTVFSGIEDDFEFEFENDSLTDGTIEFGSILNMQEQTVYYNGDAETGITIIIHAVGEAKNITIYNVGTREYMSIDTDKLKELTGSGLIAGDEITINTSTGHKSITLLRSGVTTNILNCLNKSVDWFQLSKGDNIFAYIAESGSENLQFRIRSKVIYEGV